MYSLLVPLIGIISYILRYSFFNRLNILISAIY